MLGALCLPSTASVPDELTTDSSVLTSVCARWHMIWSLQRDWHDDILLHVA
jgi:hypothetical protein